MRTIEIYEVIEMTEVKVFSTPSCPYCSMAKDFFDENNIEYEDIDVSANREGAREMIQKSGQTGVPVIEIDGNIVIGFDLPRIKRYLDME